VAVRPGPDVYHSEPCSWRKLAWKPKRCFRLGIPVADGGELRADLRGVGLRPSGSIVSQVSNARPGAPGHDSRFSWRKLRLGVCWLPFAAKMVALQIGLVIQTKHSSLPRTGKPGFHAEWLRDEPCDATTTCPRKTGVWCQLLPGNGEHEIRGSLQQSWHKRFARFFESFHVRSLIEPVTRSYT
jgi:hypothetical protein